ncbi:MAG: hypothetical protein IRZ10_06180 [Thermoflavifilum sp.]|nr:hypothetical protein [Thermoflavifilum sp.]MCL6513992.1 hypothetical protein [Alicyclobacillus sp.]
MQARRWKVWNLPAYRDAASVEGGHVLLATLGVLMAMTLSALTVYDVIHKENEVVLLTASGDTAYWLARSAALAALRQLQSGQTPAANSTMQVPDGSVHITCTAQSAPSGVTWTIRANARAGGAVDTVVVTYSALSHSVIGWQDNAPGS